MWITSSLTTAKTPTRVALGNFDGVHLGHQRVIEPVLIHKGEQDGQRIKSDNTVSTCLETAKAAFGYSNWPASWAADSEPSPSSPNRNGYGAHLPSAPETFATVVTFFPHPQEYFSGQSKPLLTPLVEKTQQLDRLGVEQLILLPFNQHLAGLSAEAFVETVLIQGLKTEHISVGSDFRFGKGRSGDVDLLVAIATQHQIPVTVVPLKHDDDGRISSSRIRQALQQGNLANANRLLGRHYTLTGKVVQGQQLGRKLGFPTANLKLPTDKFIPRQGVYSVRVCCDTTDSPAQSSPQLGVMNIGNRPTVAGQDLSVEVHILDWSGDLYGKTLTVSLQSFLRPEQKFNSLEDLKQQIELDCQIAAADLRQPVTS